MGVYVDPYLVANDPDAVNVQVSNPFELAQGPIGGVEMASAVQISALQMIIPCKEKRQSCMHPCIIFDGDRERQRAVVDIVVEFDEHF